MRRAFAAAALLALALTGCQLVTGLRSELEPALIIFYGDTSEIRVPDTAVTRGTGFTIEVTTFAGGCTRQAAGTTVGVAGNVAEVRPVNRRERSPGCTDDLLYLKHVAFVRFDAAGPATIRVVGAQRGGSTGSTTAPATLERSVTVR